MELAKKNKLNKLKLRGRFIIIIVFILVSAFVLMGYFLLKSTRNTLSSTLNQETTTFIALATKPIGDSYEVFGQSGTINVRNKMQQYASLDPSITNISVINLNDYSQFSLTGQPIQISRDQVSTFKGLTNKNQKRQIVSAVQPYIDDQGIHAVAIAFQISPAQVEREINRQGETLILLVVLALLLCIVATYLFMDRLFIAPLNSLSNTAGEVAGGQFNNSTLDIRGDEIGMLAASVNNMANKLKNDIIQLKELDKLKDEFIKIVSHNLRTPLTIIEGNVSLLNDSDLSAPLKKMVSNISDSAKQLTAFAEQMLTITDYESDSSRPPFVVETSLNDMLGVLIRDYTDMAEQKTIDFKPHIENGEIRFLCAQSLIVQGLRNLLDNAIKFTPEHGLVELFASVDQKLIIKVKDNGIGIKPEELPKLFTKFHRGSDVMQYNYEGTGIGLYVTKLILDELGGTISADSRQGTGTTMTIELPLKPAQPPTAS